jgi:hypothetical protein
MVSQRSIWPLPNLLQIFESNSKPGLAQAKKPSLPDPQSVDQVDFPASLQRPYWLKSTDLSRIGNKYLDIVIIAEICTA